MIKVGQFMSSRLDVLPPEITKELEGLQDEVPPVPFPAIRELAEAELGVPLETRLLVRRSESAGRGIARPGPPRTTRGCRRRATPVCARWSSRSSARASTQIVDVDLRALRRVAAGSAKCGSSPTGSTCPHSSRSSRFTSLEEIDYLHEAAIGRALRGRLRRRCPGRAFPKSCGSARRAACSPCRTSRRSRSPIVDGLRAAGIDPSEVAIDFASVMFDQLFRNGFFHADPHPGNIFVTPLPGGDDLPADGPGDSPSSTSA